MNKQKEGKGELPNLISFTPPLGIKKFNNKSSKFVVVLKRRGVWVGEGRGGDGVCRPPVAEANNPACIHQTSLPGGE